jgi:hypothetical protein
MTPIFNLAINWKLSLKSLPIELFLTKGEKLIVGRKAR